MTSPYHRTTLWAAPSIAALLLLPLPALASVPSAILAQPTAPIRIDRCIADVRDSSVGNRNYFFETAVQFTNITHDVVTAVRFRFDTFNAFGEHLRSYRGSSEDALDPQATENDIKPSKRVAEMAERGRSLGLPPPQDLIDAMYDPTWRFTNLDDTAHSAVCSVDTVMFESGKKWQAAPIAAKALASAASHASRPKPDIVLETNDEQ